LINRRAIAERAGQTWAAWCRGARHTASFLVSGAFMAAVAILVGCGLAVAGVHVLFGLGWALLAGAVPTLATGFLILRGVIDGK